MAAKLTRPRAELEKLFEETMDSGIKFYGLVDDTAPNRMIGILSQWDKGAVPYYGTHLPKQFYGDDGGLGPSGRNEP